MTKINIILVLFFFSFFSCLNEQTNKISPTKNSLRIVSLASSISDELIDLGLKENIVGATSYCKIAKNNKELIIGSALEVNEEKILLLKPDIVFATSLTKSKTIDILKKNGVDVFVYKKASSFDAICNNFLNLGKKVNKEKEAKKIIDIAKKRIVSIQEKIPANTPPKKIFFQIGANPIATVIPDTYMNEFITLNGCTNIFHDLNSYIIGRESVLIRNPEIIFITTMGIIGDEEIENWFKYKELKAVKNKKIYSIDSNISSSPTVTNFVKTLEIMFKKIYF